MGACGSKASSGKVANVRANDPAEGVSRSQSSNRISAAVMKKQKVYDELISDPAKTETFQKVSQRIGSAGGIRGQAALLSRSRLSLHAALEIH